MNKILMSVVLMLSSISAVAGDADAGKAKSAICAACHGANGVTLIPTYPNIAGQNEEYMILSLKSFRAGERQGGNAALMTPMAANLSDEDIDDLAAYYSSL